MADRNVIASNTFEEFRVEFNELATDVGDIASITGASGIIASASDVVEAVTLLNTAVNISDLDGAGDSGTFAVDLDTQSLTIAGTSNEIETSASGQTLTIGLPNNVTISGNATIGGNISNGSVNLTFPTVGGAISTEGFSIALATALGLGKKYG